MKLNKISNQGYVKAGKRVGSTSPELVVTSTYNQFNVSDPACEMLGVEPLGAKVNDNPLGYVRLWDYGEEDGGFRFFITTGFYSEGEIEGAKLGENRGCTMSPVWSAMHATNPNLPDGPIEVKELNLRSMEEKGIVAEGTKIALWKGYYKVAPCFLTSEDPEEAEVTLEDTGIPATTNTFGKLNKPIENEDGDQIDLQFYALIDPKFVEHNPKNSDTDVDDTTGEVVTSIDD